MFKKLLFSLLAFLVMSPAFADETLIVYPSLDGSFNKAYNIGDNISWSTITTVSAATNTDYSGSETEAIAMQCDTNTNDYIKLNRAMFLFDTSALTTNATVSNVVMSLWATSINNSVDADAPALDIFTASPASTSSLVNDDFDQIQSVSQTTGSILFSNLSSAPSYSNWTFNSTGIGNISLDSISKFGAKESAFDATGSTPTWQSIRSWGINLKFSEASGTTNDPKLNITYTVAAGDTGAFLNFMD